MATGGAWQSEVFDSNGRNSHHAPTQAVPPVMYNPSPVGEKDSKLLAVVALSLRVAQVVLSLIAFAIMAANKQTLYDAYYSDVYYTGVYYYIKFSSVKSFVGVLALNCIVCFYAAVHLVHTLVTLSSKRSSATTGFAILTFVFDTVLAYALMGASAAGADSAMYLRDEGCGSFEKFCQRAEASVALSFLAFAVMAASAALYPVRLLKLMKG